ncbi:MAG: WGR domain-containing protein, partial [Actinobacteria bacterium]|nr:WGR domain-containing protein [Actinomycetota bacterium]
MSESKMLIMFDSKNNNNKFYEATLDDVGNIAVRFGRVGGGVQTTSYSGGKKKFDSLVASKIKKGYKEAQLEAVSGETGLTQKVNVVDIALKQIDCKDDTSRNLIQAIAKANIHNITSSTNIKYDEKDGLFKTPLGVVKKSAVEEAMIHLGNIESLLDEYEKCGKGEDEILTLNDSYFVLIPNKVATTRDKRHLLFSQKNIDEQREICKALLETLDLIEELKKNQEDKPKEEVEVEKIFNFGISHVEDSATIDRIVKYYNESKNAQHGGRIMGSKVKNIYKINLGNQQAPFDKAITEYGN